MGRKFSVAFKWLTNHPQTFNSHLEAYRIPVIRNSESYFVRLSNLGREFTREAPLIIGICIATKEKTGRIKYQK